MNILAFDTASSSGAVAIMKDGAIIAHTQLNIGLTHSEQLLPAVDDLMQLTGMKMAQFDAIAITAGPGSFTGLRIGVSTAKGMALGLKKPLIPLSTLDVLAQNGAAVRGLIVPIMNARRKQVYTAVYRSNGQEITRQSDYQAIAIADLLQEIKAVAGAPLVYFTGDGVERWAIRLCSPKAAENLSAPMRWRCSLKKKRQPGRICTACAWSRCICANPKR